MGVHMVAWIIYFREAAIYNQKYIQLHIEEGAKLGIHVKLILVEDLEFGVKDNQWFLYYHKENITIPDFAICRAIYPLLTKQLELMGIKVFNNSFVAEICNDKAKTYQYLAKTGIKMVDTCFYLNEQVPSILADIKGATVIKAVEGHGGSQVFLLQPEDVKDFVTDSEAEEDIINYNSIKNRNTIINGLDHSNVVVQPLIGSRHQDLRVYVIGKEMIAAVLRTAKDGFKSNFSLGGEVRSYQLKEEEKNIVQKIIDQFDFDLVGIDFIIGDSGELIFNEIEDVVGSRMLYQCTDINIVQRYLEYIKYKRINAFNKFN